MLVFRARVRDHSLPRRRCRSAPISRPCAGAEQRKNHFLRTIGLSRSSAIHELMSSGQNILFGVASPTWVFFYGKLALGIGSALATPLGVGGRHKNREDHFLTRQRSSLYVQNFISKPIPNPSRHLQRSRCRFQLQSGAYS